MTEPRVQSRRLRRSLAGRIWKTMTQINLKGLAGEEVERE